MDVIILSIGTELVRGQTVDTNSAWLSLRLAEIGANVLMHLTVSDDLGPICREIERAAGMADVVLISGGLGPTEDDLTRHALAELLGSPLELHEPSLAQIRDFFTVRNRTMPEANTIQAMFPAGSTPIQNTCGTAPGIRARIGRAEVFAVPGVPRELQVMYDRDIHPVLQARSGGAVTLVRNLWCYGAGESDIGDTIRDLMARGRNPSVGTTAQETIIGVRILAHGATPAEAEALLARDSAEVRRRLGKLVYGQDDDTLQSAVGKLLIQAGKTVATAESCTGGLIAASLTDVPGSSAYFPQGWITYANAAKEGLLGVPTELIRRHGAVSREVAEAMAVNCRRAAGTDYALSVTGIAGPTGGTPEKPVGLVFIGLADAAGCEVSEHRMGEVLTRRQIRDRSCKVALNRLRLKLLDA